MKRTAGYYVVAMVLLAGRTPARAQPPAEEEVLGRVVLSGESTRTARQLAAAAKLVEQGKTPEAVEQYQRVLTEAGDDLVPLDARHALQARRLCHLSLAAMPAEALALYRTRVDGQAKKWLEQGLADRDPTLLRRLVDETFCSRFTDRALDLLGDLAFEQGDFDEAMRWWRMLVLPASEKDKPRRHKDELVYPDPSVDVARVRAKQILAQLFRGEPGYQAELQAFQKLHPRAQGRFAGRDGTYASILEGLAAQADALRAPPSADSWTTFGGDAARNGQLPRARGTLARFPHFEGPTWTIRIDTGALVQDRGTDSSESGKVLGPSTDARLLSYYPVLAGNRVLVAGASFVSGYDLPTGRRVLHYDLAADLGEAESSVSPASDACYTLSASEERVFARLGAQRSGSSRRKTGADSFLVCLNLGTTSGSPLRWKVPAKSTEGPPAVFEGAPIVHQGRVYVAETRPSGVQALTSIACYDADRGALRWQREICATKEFKDNERPIRHHLLTLAGPNLVYCSHSGAIIALDADAGRPAWAVRYASRGLKTRDGDPSPRSLAPCLYAGGRVYAAPLDLDRILCLDALTGHLVWESTPLEVVHLLGAARGRLLFTSITPRKSIQALDLANGNTIRAWYKPDDDSDLPSYGRGLLAGDWVFWPTRLGLYILTLERAETVFFDANIRGNLAAANGCLVVAGSKELSAYVASDQTLRQREQDVHNNPASATALFRLAVAQGEAGLEAQALEHFVRAEALAGPDERSHGVPLRRLIRERRHALLLASAEQAQEAGDRDRALALLSQAASVEFPAAARLKAVSRQADDSVQAGQPERAVGTWQAVLEDAILSRGQLVTADGLPQSGAIVAAAQIDALIQSHGRGIYETIEQRAQRLLTAASKEEQKEVLGRLGREFPERLGDTPAGRNR